AGRQIIQNHRGQELRGGLAVNGDILFRHPFTTTLKLNQQADSTTDQLQNRTLWSSYTEIIDVKQCYPNTAIVGLQVDAEQF
ncbi:hypothetical protein ACSLPA_33965, partial [Escherichia coli]